MAGRQDAFSIPGPADVEKALIRAINKERRAAGVGELRVSPDLAAAARDHSRAMAAASVLSHTSPDGRSPTLRLVLAGIFFAASGENVASSTGFSAALIHRALMESPEHRSNILDPEFDMAGIGVAGKWPRTAYVTQDFIRSLPVVPEAVAAERTKRRVNALRLKNGLRPLVFWPEADAFAKRLSIVDSIGASRPSFPERFGEIQSLLVFRPGAFRHRNPCPLRSCRLNIRTPAWPLFRQTSPIPEGPIFPPFSSPPRRDTTSPARISPRRSATASMPGGSSRDSLRSS